MLKHIVLVCLFYGVLSARKNFSGKDPIVGRNCTAEEVGTSKVLYYLDIDRNVAYPFKYLGCGESNGGSYGAAMTMSDMGLPGCPGFSHHTDTCFDNTHRILPSSKPLKNCTADHYCMVYPYFGGDGICCSTDVTKKYDENRKGECPAGSIAVLNKQINEILFGKKCSHDFCPTGSKCIDGAFEAYCCQKQ